MKVIRNINNNVAVCLDGNGVEVVAFGKGIGFKKAPYEVELSKIDATYYNIEPHYIALLQEIPEDVMIVTMEIVEKGQSYLGTPISKTFVFALADHIHFAIENSKKGVVLSNPLTNEIQYLYEKEMRLGEWALKHIKKKLGITLANTEAGSIALHFINAQRSASETQKKNDEDSFVEDITDIIESSLDIIIDRDQYSYSRFVTHLKYLLRRFSKADQYKSDNVEMYQSVTEKFPELVGTVDKIKQYINAVLNVEPSDEELFYLMIHINRLCARDGL